MTDAILIADLYERCKPGGNVCRQYDPEKWLAYDYGIEEFSGTNLFCGPEQNVPELEIPLNKKGWYRIFLGIHYGMVAFPLESRIQIAGFLERRECFLRLLQSEQGDA